MAQVLVTVNLGYNDMLIVDSKDAQVMMEIVDRAKTVSHKYTDNIAVYRDGTDAVSLCVKSFNSVNLMTPEMFTEYEAKKAARVAAEAE